MVIPSFGIYLAMNFATQILQALLCSLTQISFIQALTLALVYPFSLGFTVAFVMLPHKISLAHAAVLAVSMIIYMYLGYFGLKYTGQQLGVLVLARLY